MITKDFHIGDILSVTSGRLVSPRHVDGIYDLLSWMADEPVWTHQLPRVAEECAPSLRRQFPDLAAVQVPSDFDGEASVLSWLASLESQCGTTRQVERLEAGEHTSIGPISEMGMMRPDMPIIGIVSEGDQS